VEDRKENASYCNVSQHDGERKEGVGGSDVRHIHSQHTGGRKREKAFMFRILFPVLSTIPSSLLIYSSPLTHPPTYKGQVCVQHQPHNPGIRLQQARAVEHAHFMAVDP
jgi:hypothetical protein